MLLAEIYRQLDSTDFKILSLFERLLNKYEYIPLDIIERRIILPPRELANKLRKLHKLKVIKRSLTPFHGYRLTYLGLDCIALRDLVRKDIIAYLGDKIGMGKESEIYIAKDKEGNLLAVKFYKIGRISFQKVARVRSYLTDERNWMIRSMVAAEREFKALKDLINHTPYVPKVRGWSKHAVVIDYIEGIELYRYKNARDPESILKRILHALRAAFINLGIIHGDLSEYNVLVEVKEEIPYIIDWPQYLYKDNLAHETYLKRDVEYIVKFFKRKYRVNIDSNEALKYVKGIINEL
ncbi:MAG: serine/threonine protein kinase [Desulfurococcales archaeon ex4484_42]|nr:MAG: serine/threonine protein kinase [Desulfurococcales archaeon ex4484_42]